MTFFLRNYLLMVMEMEMDQAVKDQLGRALISHKNKKWPLYKRSQWDQFKTIPTLDNTVSSSLMIYPTTDEYIEYLNHREGNPSNIKSVYSALQPILDKFRGKIVLAGGSMTEQFCPKDVDLFFINCSDEEMKKIIEESSEIIRECHSNQEASFSIEITDFLHNIKVKGVIAHPNDMSRERTLIYQFIKKSHSNISELLAGFDMFASQIAYDGSEVWATESGAWAYVNNILIIDISHISKSFGHRCLKYSRKLFKLIIPGIHTVEKHLQMTNYDHYRNDFEHDDIIVNGLKKNDRDLIYPIMCINYLTGTAKDYSVGNKRLMADEFYIGDHYKRRKCYPIIDVESETILRLARRDPENIWSTVPRDIFNLIMAKIPYVL